MSTSTLDIQVDDRCVVTIALNRPERHNAMNRVLMDELTQALASHASNARVLVLRGNGPSFCAGADIQWMKDSAQLNDDENRQDALVLSGLLQALDDFPAPTVAAIHGAALGGGFGIACCVDAVVATEDCRFALSEARLGLIPATISPYVLRAIGARASRRYMQTAERFDSATALRLGLAHEVCATDQLNACVDQLLNELLSSGPNAQAEIRDLIRAVDGQPRSDELRDNVVDRLARVRTGEEAQEGFAAFLEKRPPTWRR